MKDGPEDSVLWKKNNNLSDTNHGADCLACGDVIIVAHCANGGCPWCARCGESAKPEIKGK